MIGQEKPVDKVEGGKMEQGMQSHLILHTFF